MPRAASPIARYAHVLLSSALLALLLFACNAAPLAPRAGLFEFMAPSVVAVPGGHVNAAGGNYFHRVPLLSLDTRVGPFSLEAVYNSAWGWTLSLDATYKNGTLRDATGALMPLTALAAGAAAPGTHWVKLDAARVKTKGGLVHAFDAATGRLLAIHWSSAPYPQLRFVQTQVAGQWRASSVEQCTSASACAPVLALQYDAAGRLLRADDRAGRSALLGYDAAGKLSSARDGLDVAKGWPGERYAYASNLLSAITNSEGERIEIRCDPLGRTLEVRAVGAGDPSWRFVHGLPDVSSVHTVTATDPLGATTHYAIDASARTLSVTNALAERTAFTWVGLRPSSRSLPDGTSTRWTWADDDLASETLPSGNVRTLTYQAGAENRERPLAPALLEARDSLGLVERRSYDASGRLTGVTNGASETTALAWDASGQLASVTSPSGVELRFSGYGEHGRPAFTTYGAGTDAAVSTYDAVGNRIRGTEADPASGGVKQRVFDADRNLAALELIDAPASGSPTVQLLVLERRSDGQLARVARPGGGATRFGYDARGQLVSISESVSPGASPTAGAESVTTFERDLLGRVVATERANGMREEVSYDAAGRVSRRRVLQGGVPESDVTFEYSDGRAVRAHDEVGFDEALDYDTAGRLAEVVHSGGERTSFRYDERSRLTHTQLAAPAGTALVSLSHGWDGADRERTLGYLGTDLIARSIVGGRLERTYYGNGIRQDHFRNTQSGRAAGRELWRGSRRIEKSDYPSEPAPGGALLQQRSEVDDGTSADATTLEEFSYATLFGQNAMERRVRSSRALGGTPIEAMQYDALSNFVGGAGPGMPQAVGLNAEGNRVLSATMPPPAQWEPRAERSYAYDAAGFTTRETFTNPGDAPGENRFAWNARGQLAAIHSDGTPVARFEYDALGRRSARVANGATKRWRFGGLVEVDATGNPLAVDLGEVRIELGGRHLYRHADLRGNPKHVTNAEGRVVRHNAYAAYGQTLAFGAQADDLGFANGTPITTPHASYVLIGARLYSPSLARFLSPDPVWNPVNLYSYTFGNPIDFWDPSGLHAGGHHDLAIARLKVAGSLVAYAGVVLAFTAAGSAIATVGAAILVVGAGIAIASALVELDRQESLHRERTRAERRDTPENNTGGPGGFLGGGGSTGGSGGYDWSICSDDGMGAVCTSGRGGSSGVGSGWISYPHILAL